MMLLAEVTLNQVKGEVWFAAIAVILVIGFTHKHLANKLDDILAELRKPKEKPISLDAILAELRKKEKP